MPKQFTRAFPAVVGLLTNDNYVQDFDVGENTNVGVNKDFTETVKDSIR